MHELVIRFDPNKGVTVSGAINDKVLAYGMLESARDAIQEHHTRMASEKRILQPIFVPPNLTDRNGGKGS